MQFGAKAASFLRASKIVVSQSRNLSPRWGHVIPVPPTTKIPFPEKFALATFMLCGLISIPTWVLYNLEYYKTGGVRTTPSETLREIEPKEETKVEREVQDMVARGEK